MLIHIPISLLALLVAPIAVSAAPSGWSGPTCYTDSTSARLLTGKYVYNAAMTDSICASACAGYQYFGLEYSTECYCGNSFANAKSVVDSSQCNYKCGGSSLMCGGSDRISVYTSTTPAAPTSGVSTAPSNWKIAGCYSDQILWRTLTAKYSSGSMSLEKCASTCSGYKYFGVEYGNECYCGDAISNGGSSQDASGCNMKCSGSSGQFCGGSNRLGMYEATTSTSPTTSPSPSPKTSPSPSPSPSPAAVAYGVSSAPSTWKISGCFSDQVLYRTLTAKYTSGSMTVDKCASSCAGYKYFGVEYGNECYCGNVISNGGASKDLSGCNMKCSGNSAQYCGGSDRLGMYESTTTVVTSPSPSPSPASSSVSELTETDIQNMVKMVNQIRASAGRSALTHDIRLSKAAADHSRDMASHCTMTHAGFDGSAFGDRINKYASWSWAGEVIGAGYGTTTDIINGWKGSSSHYNIMVNTNAKQVGFALITNKNCGSYKTYWSGEFANLK